MVREQHILPLSKTFEVQQCSNYCEDQNAQRISCIEPDLKQTGNFWLARVHDSAKKPSTSSKHKVGDLTESTLVCKVAVPQLSEGPQVLLEGCIIVAMLEVA